MRFVHISDTHLGAAGFSRRISPSGFNQREEDICNSFISAVDKIIEIKPDFVLHSGDLFHSVRPSNRIINLAIRQLLRITDLKIPMVIISGNHDTPKQRTVGSIFSIFEVFDHIHPVYRNKYETVGIKEACIHAIPHCITIESLHEELAKIKPDNQAKYNVLMLHGVVAGIKEFSMGELAEQEIPNSYFTLEFDYVALGHYHKHTKVMAQVYYAGSTERLSMAELGQEKGFVEVDLDAEHVNFHPVPTREMIELSELDASGWDQTQVINELRNIIDANDITDKIVRPKIKNISNHVYNSLPLREIAELKKEAFHFDLRFEKKDEEGRAVSSGAAIRGLNQEFTEFVNKTAVDGLDKDKLLQMGLRYLSVPVRLEKTGEGDLGFEI